MAGALSHSTMLYDCSPNMVFVVIGPSTSMPEHEHASARAFNDRGTQSQYALVLSLSVSARQDSEARAVEFARELEEESVARRMRLHAALLEEERAATERMIQEEAARLAKEADEKMRREAAGTTTTPTTTPITTTTLCYMSTTYTIAARIFIEHSWSPQLNQQAACRSRRESVWLVNAMPMRKPKLPGSTDWLQSVRHGRCVHNSGECTRLCMCGAVRVWGCACVGLCACGAVRVWGCACVGLCMCRTMVTAMGTQHLLP